MANEVNWTIQGYLKAGKVFDQIQSLSYAFDQLAPGRWSETISVPTTGITIVPAVTTLGWAMFINLDDTNYIQIGDYPSSTLAAMGRLKPGEFAILPLDPGLTLRAQAHTTTCDLDLRVWNR